MTTSSLIFTHDSRTTSRIYNNSVIFPAITTMTNTWSQTVIFPAIITNLSHHRTGVVINQVFINTVDSQCDRHELGPYPRARLSIDLIYTLQRLAHCTHTTEPWPRTPIWVDQSIPTKPSYCHDTLPATPTNSPLG